MPAFTTPIIDTAIGLIVVYIAFSLLASWLKEQLSSFLQTRSKMLIGAIIQLLSGKPGMAATNNSSAAAQEKVAVAAPEPTNTTTAGNAKGIVPIATPDPVDPATSAAAKAFFGHPIFTSLKQSTAQDPQYLSAQQFSSILVGLLKKDPTGTSDGTGGRFDFTQITEAADKLGIGEQVRALVAKANGDYEAFVKALEDWYDDHMDRVSGWFAKHTQIALVCIGLFLALLWNVDSLRIVRALSCNAALRTSTDALHVGDKNKPNPALIGSVLDSVPLGWQFSGTDVPERKLSCDVAAGTAEAAAAEATTADAKEAAAKQVAAHKKVAGPNATDADRKAMTEADDQAAQAHAAAAKALAPPVAFNGYWEPIAWALLKVIGFVITAVALSLGAPFWFDALSQLTRVRNAGKKPDNKNPSNATAP